jgi:hypothetical protein
MNEVVSVSVRRGGRVAAGVCTTHWMKKIVLLLVAVGLAMDWCAAHD